MAKVQSFSKTGSKQDSQVTLDKGIFGLDLNHQLLELAYRSYMAAGRQSSAKTLTRGDVRGGGKKPWRQKGTGRARAGSIRIPHWRGGGVVWGNTGEENYQIKLNTKTKRLALRQALSAQAADGHIAVLESFSSTDGKVKPTLQLLGKLGFEGNVVLVVDKFDALVDRSTRNLAGLTTVAANYLNIYTIMTADYLIFTKDALKAAEAWLGEGKAETKTEPKPAPKTEAKAAAGETK